jgi:hypothetical protein
MFETPYFTRRKCLHCGKPIADNAHAARKFCPRQKLPDGSILSCKDDYHVKKNRPINAPFKWMASYQKYFYNQIKLLVEREGYKVTFEQLNQYGINLHRPFEFIVNKENRYVYFYHQFVIEQMPENKFKITRHEIF